MILDTDLESIQEARRLLEQAKSAQEAVSQMTQEQIDKIVHKMAQVAMKEAGRLASMAVEETGYGNVEDKLTKNHFSAKDIYESIKEKKTVGIINRDETNCVWEVAEPMGVVVGILPSTNPTSTAIFKALIAVKSRNAIVLNPHPAAARCTGETIKVMQEAAELAGAPKGLVSSLTEPTVASANELMKHDLSDVILATGGTGMVKAAYSSGKPAFGVGSGNVPVFIHSSANIERSVKQIVHSKTFDNGTICASEQALVVEKSIARKTKTVLESEGAYFLDEYERKKMAELIMDQGKLNPAIVGKSPQALADLAGIYIEDDVKLLIAEETCVGNTYPFSVEKLSPILAFYVVEDNEEARSVCKKLLELGGLGHTMGIHCEDQQIIEKFGLEQPVSRVIVNSGTTFGGIGATTGIQPSMTLGVGTAGNSVSSDNIGPEHLLNIKRIAFGIREMENEKANYNINNLNNGNSVDHHISRAEVMDIVKSVLQELKL